MENAPAFILTIGGLDSIFGGLGAASAAAARKQVPKAGWLPPRTKEGT